MQKLTVQFNWAKTIGVCNFHNDKYDRNGGYEDYKVLVIGGPGTQIRICKKCFKSVKKIEKLFDW